MAAHSLATQFRKVHQQHAAAIALLPVLSLPIAHHPAHHLLLHHLPTAAHFTRPRLRNAMHPDKYDFKQIVCKSAAIP